ncbi:hypothetical protein GCM10022222_50980 [Amycolatopsis ultiminotia]|uniref:Cupin domain-containing protein n=1 Tax=Amycolatopsis ultiminotia TaxID=543629 RepID=A0ABP6X482_9PSEU
MLFVLSGRLAIVHGTHEPTLNELRSGSAAWINQNTPYLLANIGTDEVTGLVFSTDPRFDHDTSRFPALEATARALLAPVIAAIPAPTRAWVS